MAEQHCRHCGAVVKQPAGAITRAMKLGANLFCGKSCAGLFKSVNGAKYWMTDAERRAAKSEYDKRRRAQMREEINARKRQYHHATKHARADVLRAHRVKRREYHAEYCRQPQYVERKAAYDRDLRARKQFGEFAEAFLILQKVEGEVADRATRQEIMQTNGTYNKAQNRRRALCLSNRKA